MALIGTPEAVSDLMDRVRAGAPGLHDELRHAFGFIDNPASYDLVLQAASGYAPDTSKALQLAAIEGLGGYPEEFRSGALNQLLAQDHDQNILRAIFATLGGEDDSDDDDDD